MFVSLHSLDLSLNLHLARFIGKRGLVGKTFEWGFSGREVEALWKYEFILGPEATQTQDSLFYKKISLLIGRNYINKDIFTSKSDGRIGASRRICLLWTYHASYFIICDLYVCSVRAYEQRCILNAQTRHARWLGTHLSRCDTTLGTECARNSYY